MNKQLIIIVILLHSTHSNYCMLRSSLSIAKSHIAQKIVRQSTLRSPQHPLHLARTHHQILLESRIQAQAHPATSTRTYYSSTERYKTQKARDISDLLLNPIHSELEPDAITFRIDKCSDEIKNSGCRCKDNNDENYKTNFCNQSTIQGLTSDCLYGASMYKYQEKDYSKILDHLLKFKNFDINKPIARRCEPSEYRGLFQASKYDSDTLPALHFASKYDLVNCASVLLNKSDVDINEKGPHRFTPLHYAATPRIAHLLLKHGADVHGCVIKKETPLHVCPTAVVPILIKYKAATDRTCVSDILLTEEKLQKIIHKNENNDTIELAIRKIIDSDENLIQRHYSNTDQSRDYWMYDYNNSAYSGKNTPLMKAVFDGNHKKATILMAHSPVQSLINQLKSCRVIAQIQWYKTENPIYHKIDTMLADFQANPHKGSINPTKQQTASDSPLQSSATLKNRNSFGIVE